MKTDNKLAASNELLGALLSGSDNSADMKDMKSYIYGRFNVYLGDLDISVVENTTNVMNVVLPFYSSLDEPAASHVGEDDLDSIAGGEIVSSNSSAARVANIAGQVIPSQALAQATLSHASEGSLTLDDRLFLERKAAGLPK